MSRWTRFIMGRVWRLLVLLGALGLSLDGLAAQQQRALLVGVSALVHQPPSLWLQAPRNDVTLMRQALLGQGWSAADIVTLADGVPGAELPDLDRIRSALQDLLDRSSSGDLALLYFSGHGTRWRDPDKPYEEPDSLAEVFLTREVQGRQGGAVAPQGGLRDVEFEAWIDAFQAKNVFVWSVFDTCAATSMTRSGRGAGAAVQGDDGSDEVRFRGVRATELRHGRQAPASADAPPVPAGGRVPRALRGLLCVGKPPAHAGAETAARRAGCAAAGPADLDAGGDAEAPAGHLARVVQRHAEPLPAGDR